MKAHELPTKERQLLQVLTIILITVVTLLFIKQRIITAMITGALGLGAQQAYLYYRKQR